MFSIADMSPTSNMYPREMNAPACCADTEHRLVSNGRQAEKSFLVKENTEKIPRNDGVCEGEKVMKQGLTNGSMHKQQAVDRAVAVQGVSRNKTVRSAVAGEGHVETVEGGPKRGPQAL